MDRFRGPRAGTNNSKASASTVCQKCLKRGHYSYECKATVQDRPYASRPSRTQQLLNPKLAPRLNDENPNKLLDKAGVADGILAAKQHPGRGGDTAAPSRRGRSRSASSYSSYSSSDSVSTVSTRASRSRSRSRDGRPASRRQAGARHTPPPPEVAAAQQQQHGDRDKDRGRKRQRRDSTDSYSSYDSRDGSGSRGRARSGPARRDHRDTRRRRRSWSGSSDRSVDAAAGPAGGTAGRGLRRSRSGSRVRGRAGDGGASWEARAGCERPAGRPRSPLQARSRSRSRSRSPFRRAGLGEAGPGDGGRWRGASDAGGPNGHHGAPAPPARKERSLSPYSKRLALTRTINR